jgi:hypothetical protein
MFSEWLQTRRVFVAILALGLFVLAARNVTDPDVWWHLRTGQLIVQGHKTLHTDPYSFTRAGYPWVDHEWLSEILIFGLYRAAGYAGLITAFAALIAVTFLLLFVRSPARPFVAGALTACGAIASAPSFGVRPQMLTLLLACVFLFILEQSYLRPKLLWWMLPIMLLWVNLHAGYALGIVFIAVFLGGDALDYAFGNRKTALPPARFRNLALIALACIAIIPLNPYGIAMYRYPFETLHSRSMLGYIGEWASPDFHQARYLPFLLLILGTLGLPALSYRRLSARELLLLAVTLYAALRSVRHIPIYVLVAVPFLSTIMQALLQESGKTEWFQRPLQLSYAKSVINAILLASFITFTVARVAYVIRHQPAAESKEFPEDAVKFFARVHPPAPILNHYNWGGYFIWKLYPEYKVFIDGRADVYGDSFIDEFASLYYVKGESWGSPLEKWRLRTIALPPDAPLITLLSTQPGWDRIFSDGQTVVLSRSH